MLRYLIALVITVAPVCQFQVCQAQEASPAKSPDHSALAAALGFEIPPAGVMPGGWGGGPSGTIFADDKVLHSGRGSARIERHPDSSGNFSSITTSIPMDFSGATIELRGFLRTEDVSDFVGLWMREDGDAPGLAFDNMQARQLKGTTDWKEYSISLPVQPEAKKLVFGVLLAGTGKAWADDLQLLVDGKPVWDAPKRPETVVDLDHEFDGGSGINVNDLTKVQIDNLVMLGKVWGFLKYYHPKITSGERHWDYDLFRVLPKVLAAKDHTAANAALQQWIENLGPVANCNPCAKLNEKDVYYEPDLAWLADTVMLGADLSQTLQTIRDNRLPDRQFYVSKVAEVGNPRFEHELGYANLKLPDSGFQLLALYRFWTIIEYWSPYRDLVGEDWTTVLAQFIPRVAEARNPESYRQEMLVLIAKARDGHANLWSALDARPPAGKCQLPVSVRFIEDVPVVTSTTDSNTELKVGDVVTELDGVPVAQLIENWKAYYADSNEAARMRDIGRSMTRGECGESMIGIRRDKEKHQLKLKVTRTPIASPGSGDFTHDLPGPTFRLLSKDVAYLKLSSVKLEDAASYVQQAAGTKGFVIDIRNYPSSFMVFALGSLLVDKETMFARFTEGDLSNPGAFHWGATESLKPEQPHYSGKVVILVDETSMSQAEYTAMAFRSARTAKVLGSTTAGADGNTSPFTLPGGLRTKISGIGVFYPDKTPTQQIGIIPDIKVRPTIAGIRAGRDEVLEEALRQILGPDAPAAAIREMANPPVFLNP
jgi:C-terminal processing protease CtpA/Prc